MVILLVVTVPLIEYVTKSIMIYIPALKIRRRFANWGYLGHVSFDFAGTT